MKYLLLTILLLSCSGRSIIKLDSVVEPSIIQDITQPSFVLAMPFEGGSEIEAVESIPVWVPVVLNDGRRARLPSNRVVLLHDTTIIPTYIKSVHYDTITVQKVVHSRGLAYLMLVIGFIIGFVVAFILMWFPRKPKSDKTEVVKRDVSESIKRLNGTDNKLISLMR